MTVPVTIKFSTPACAFCNQTFTMSFYVPKEFQHSAPEPNDPMVFKEPRKELVAYVRYFCTFEFFGVKFRLVYSKVIILKIYFMRKVFVFFRRNEDDFKVGTIQSRAS